MNQNKKNRFLPARSLASGPRPGRCRLSRRGCEQTVVRSYTEGADDDEEVEAVGGGASASASDHGGVLRLSASRRPTNGIHIDEDQCRHTYGLCGLQPLHRLLRGEERLLELGVLSRKHRARVVRHDLDPRLRPPPNRSPPSPPCAAPRSSLRLARNPPPKKCTISREPLWRYEGAERAEDGDEVAGPRHEGPRLRSRQ